MTGMRGPAPNPCQSCPYRRDVPSGLWHADEYAKLPRYDAPTWDQPGGLFQCHQNGPQDAAARVCAGWVGCHGGELLALRLAVAAGRLDGDVFDYATTVPLFTSGHDAALHGVAEIDRPSRQAVSLGGKIARQRRDVACMCPPDAVHAWCPQHGQPDDDYGT